jgi:hypothetical protein
VSACYNIEGQNTAAIVSDKILNENAGIWGEKYMK